MGPMGFFSKAILRDGLRKIRKIVTYMCDVGASLIGRSSFGHDPPQFFQGRKNENFTMAPMDNRRFVFLIFRNPPMEIRETVGDRPICRVCWWFSLSVFGTLPSFTGNKNCNFGIIFDKVLKW